MKDQPTREGYVPKKLALYVVIAVVLLVIIGLIGWLVTLHKPTSLTKGSSNAATTGVVTSGTMYTTCLTKFHDTDLCRFAATESAQPLKQTAYKASLTTSTQQGTTSSLVYGQDGKGNTTLTTSSSSAVHINSIQYQGTLYIQNGSTWLKYSSNSSLPQTGPSNNLTFLNSLVSENFTKINSEPCGNLSCLKYQLVNPTTPNATDYVWFDTHSYLLREWSSNDPSTGSVDMKINYQPVHIAAPSPVQDLTTGQ